MCKVNKITTLKVHLGAHIEGCDIESDSMYQIRNGIQKDYNSNLLFG
jgi:hypothetical protein